VARDYDIAKTCSTCQACGRELAPGEQILAALLEADEGFRREDFCLACAEARTPTDDAALVGTWRTRIPLPKEKKRLFVDDELLINFFQRLEGASEPEKVNFRFALALILMRKKLLVYDGSSKLPDGREVWAMHLRNGPPCEVIDPHLDEEKIAQVSGQLDEILEVEL